MGVVQIIAQKHLGTVLKRRRALERSLIRRDRSGGRSLSRDEAERLAAIIELCVEYGRESDPSEKQNILRTLEEIASDRGLEVPNQTIEEFESRLAQTDKSFRAEFDLEEERIRTFKKKYFLQKAKAGLSTQSAVSKKTGIPRSYIAVIETGKHRPQQKTLQKLARAFHIDVTELIA